MICHPLLSAHLLQSSALLPGYRFAVTCVGHASSGNMPLEDRVSFPPTLVPQSPLLIEYSGFCKVHVHAFAFQVFDLCFAAQLEVADGGDDLNTGDHDVEDHIKTYLVVTGAGAAVCYCISFQLSARARQYARPGSAFQHLRSMGRYCSLIHCHRSGT